MRQRCRDRDRGRDTDINRGRVRHSGRDRGRDIDRVEFTCIFGCRLRSETGMGVINAQNIVLMN